jgi:hypothetical protein
MATGREEFDLQPDPRILPMLGEINLSQWKCAAELIDNAIDGFLSVLRSGDNLRDPEIQLLTPLNEDPSGRFVVIDNGPGMSPEVLEQAVRAGWSGHDPVSSLGMFGMGFNIATARLGTVTTVFTTRAGDPEWVGLKIDFDQLRTQRHFRTPRLTEPKHDPNQHGTRVTVERLKPEQRQWFAKSGNRTKLQNELSRVYAALLRSNGVPITVRTTVLGRALEGRRHCVWGGPGNADRVVQTAKFGPVSAFQAIDVRLEPRLFCQVCWQWLPANEERCPVCERTDALVRRERAVKGWLGLQRYLSETDYGIDFLRHGRKIEIGNKDLFSWWEKDGEREEKEYPIDDPRDRGRIVGEIHLDHCRVTYTKDRFDRTDPAWEDMLRMVRGEGPLRPDKAQELGYGVNVSPLGRLFQVFRRSNPKFKKAGGWGNILVVPSNDRAEEMARKFHAGDPEHQTDETWWKLVEEADRQALLAKSGAATPGGAPPPGPTDTLDGIEEPPIEEPPTAATTVAVAPPPEPPPPPVVTAILTLTRQYVSDSTGQKWDVRAFQAEESHPSLGEARPWRLIARPQGGHEFLVNAAHAVFESATLTPLDALLAELAWSAMDFIRDRPGDTTFGRILADLRLRYAASTALDYVSLSNEAKRTLAAIAATLSSNIEPSDAAVLFKDLPPDDQKSILQKMATRGAGNPQSIIGGGRFLEYASPRAVADFFGRHPELFLDGKCWDAAYATLDYELPEATEVARSQAVRYHQSLLSDAVWLAEQDPADLAQANRARLLRALYALELLTPSVEESGE